MNFKEKNILSPSDLLNFLEENMKYGFTYGDKVFVENENFGKEMDKYYQLKTGQELVNSGYGVCWDFCEFERLFFEKMNIPHECYFFLSFYSRNEGGPTHTFLLYESNKKWFWFEYAWKYFKGIWQYNSKQEALKDIMKKFCNYNNRKYENVEVYKTTKAQAHLNSFEFVEHCLNGEKINITLEGNE